MIRSIKQILLNKIYSLSFTQLNNRVLNNILLERLLDNDPFLLGRLENTEMSIIKFIDTVGPNWSLNNEIPIPENFLRFSKINAGIYRKNITDYLMFDNNYKETINNINYFAI